MREFFTSYFTRNQEKCHRELVSSNVGTKSYGYDILHDVTNKKRHKSDDLKGCSAPAIDIVLKYQALRAQVVLERSLIRDSERQF